MMNGNGMLSFHTNYAVTTVEKLKILSNMLLKASHVCLPHRDIEVEQRNSYDEYESICIFIVFLPPWTPPHTHSQIWVIMQESECSAANTCLICLVCSRKMDGNQKLKGMKILTRLWMKFRHVASVIVSNPLGLWYERVGWEWKAFNLLNVKWIWSCFRKITCENSHFTVL